MNTLTVLHTNDLHSELEQWSAVTEIVKKQRRQAEKLGHDVLLFDIGDHSDRMHVLTEGLVGKGNTDLLNAMNYKAVTIGNNEGITMAKKDLNSLYDNAEFDILLANLFNKDGGRPDWCSPWKIYPLSNGKKAAVIGVTYPFYAFYEELGWHITDPLKEIDGLLPEMKASADFIICLSHLGYRLDKQMADKFPDIHLILGAHTHHVLNGGERVNKSWLHQCGRSGSHVGEVTVDAENEPYVAHIQTHEVNKRNRDKATDTLLKEVEKRALPFMDEVITTLPKGLEVSWYEPSPLVLLLADALREWCEADVAMVNSGLLLKGLPAGDITKRHIHEICPHPINPAKVSMSGSDLYHLMKQSNDNTMINYPLKGYGFRGKVLGLTLYASEEWTTSSMKDVETYGAGIDPKRYYSVAVPDLITFSHLYPFVTELASKTYYMPEFLRDLLAWKLKEPAGKQSESK
ncbi:bifunctional metallophosphatase/5'-nucleotidase [Alkalicoccus halolimnae]|uniref:Bifunctional UDP-sugar hydrolase/5'-nucleotidase n=1 Tax=Alkalicoccus halolimnae TaxID=1667239 RepID=A0A5C7F433_9BACI|nr:bifunctional UDP-sugar hydrolase/5'-nucleotidase [Alkalicoccus halolimnae]TXF84277.1 bifunctional metallophosphatase/5'-nucleotidase [Alkalicoccus halolimnae]